MTEFKYLGILFSKTNSFYITKKHIAEQGTRAMYSLLAKSRNMHLPVDLQIELFTKLVKPILLYGCEIWGFGNIDVIERVQLKYIKHVLNLKSSTPNYIVYVEVGVYPLKIDIYSRMISYWGKLNSIENFGSLANSVYLVANSFYKYSNISSRSTYFKWINSIKEILCTSGYSGIWDSHVFPNKKWLSSAIKQRYTDPFLSDWYSKIDSNLNYRIFKHKFEFEEYLAILPRNLLYYFTSFRTRNHKLAIETGRWTRLQHNERKCNLCYDEIGDEFHYLLKCKKLNAARKEYLKPKHFVRPNIIKYENLMNSKNKALLISMAKFIKIIYEIVQSD